MTGRTLLVVLAVWSLVAVAGFGAGATTYGLFTDSATGGGTISAAEQFDTTPSGAKAYDDANGNGRYDEGEPTYNKNKLKNFDDTTANLVIPSGINKVKDNSGISITANSISSAAPFEARNGNVELSASDGDITLSGTSTKTDSGQIDIEANNGHIDLDDSTLKTGTTNIEVTGNSISARNSYIETSNGEIVLTADSDSGGWLDLSDATMITETPPISLSSNGDLTLDNALVRITEYSDATANLGTSEATLSVDGVTIDDRDGELVYQPNVTVSGQPETGCVVAESGSNSVCGDG